MSGNYFNNQGLDRYSALVATITIATSTTVSSAVLVKGLNVTSIQMPAAWTAANLTFQGSTDDGVTFGPIKAPDSTGTLTATTLTSPAASDCISIPAGTFDGYTHIKLVSSAAQAADRAIRLGLRQYG